MTDHAPLTDEELAAIESYSDAPCITMTMWRLSVPRLMADLRAARADFVECEKVGMEWMRRAWAAEAERDAARAEVERLRGEVRIAADVLEKVANYAAGGMAPENAAQADSDALLLSEWASAVARFRDQAPQNLSHVPIVAPRCGQVQT